MITHCAYRATSAYIACRKSTPSLEYLDACCSAARLATRTDQSAPRRCDPLAGRHRPRPVAGRQLRPRVWAWAGRSAPAGGRLLALAGRRVAAGRRRRRTRLPCPNCAAEITSINNRHHSWENPISTVVNLDDEALPLVSEKVGTKSKVVIVNAVLHWVEITAYRSSRVMREGIVK